MKIIYLNATNTPVVFKYILININIKHLTSSILFYGFSDEKLLFQTF